MSKGLDFWSQGAQSLEDPLLYQEGEWDHNILSLSREGRYYRGTVMLPKGGALLQVISPRPVRIWVNGGLLLEAQLCRFHFSRTVRGFAALKACGQEPVTFLAEVGPRPFIEPRIFDESPSRGQRKLCEEMEKASPDRLDFQISLLPGGDFQPFGLQVLETQFVRNHVIWQRALLCPSANYPPDRLCVDNAPGSVLYPVPVEARGPVFPYDAVIETGCGGKVFLDIPVMDAQRMPAPVRREDGPDPRFEPSREMTDTAQTDIFCNGGPVRIPIPVFEPLGRLAPKREYDRYAAEALRKETGIPELILPDRLLALNKLYQHAAGMLIRLTCEAGEKSGLTGPYISTGSGFAGKQFVWDTAFTMIASKYIQKNLPVCSALDNLYSGQFDGGYIHRERSVSDGLPLLYEPGFSPNPPLLAEAEWELAENSGNRERLKEVYPALRAYHRWIYWNRRLPDGTYWTTGLASGADNAPSLGEGYPCLTAQMVQDAKILSQIAGLIGNNKDEASFQEEAAQTALALNEKLWNPALNFYCTSLTGGGHNPEKLAVNFWPLWAGVPSLNQADALAEHLKNTKEFCRHHMLPSLSADSEFFCPEGEYWRGSVWPPLVYMAVEGLKIYEMDGLARELAENHAFRMTEVLTATGDIWENYCSEKSTRGNISMPDYAWSALGGTTMLIETVLGIRTYALQRKVVWNALPEKCGIRRLPYGRDQIELSQQTERGRVFVRAQLPAGTKLEYRCGLFRHTFESRGVPNCFDFSLDAANAAGYKRDTPSV